MRYYVKAAAALHEAATLYITEDRMEAVRIETAIRNILRSVPGNEDGSISDCWATDDEKEQRSREAAARYDALTEEEKKDIIEIDGHQYIRKLYEASHKK